MQHEINMEEIITPIYLGEPEDFNWVGFGSGRGTNLRECAKVIKPALIFSDKPDADLFGLEELADARHITIDGKKYCGSWKKAKGNPDLELKYEEKSIKYNQLILKKLREFEEKKDSTIDLIVLGGYMRLIKEPLLTAFKDKIITVHPAKLSDWTNGTERKYIGEDAVYDAIKAGEEKTRSSVIMVNEKVDGGEILVMGPEVDVEKEYLQMTKKEKLKYIRKYADAHQNKQKIISDWPALTTTLKLIAENRLKLGTKKAWSDDLRCVYLDENALSYGGYQMHKANKQK